MGNTDSTKICNEDNNENDNNERNSKIRNFCGCSCIRKKQEQNEISRSNTFNIKRNKGVIYSTRSFVTKNITNTNMLSTNINNTRYCKTTESIDLFPQNGLQQDQPLDTLYAKTIVNAINYSQLKKVVSLKKIEKKKILEGFLRKSSLKVKTYDYWYGKLNELIKITTETKRSFIDFEIDAKFMSFDSLKQTISSYYTELISSKEINLFNFYVNYIESFYNTDENIQMHTERILTTMSYESKTSSKIERNKEMITTDINNMMKICLDEQKVPWMLSCMDDKETSFFLVMLSHEFYNNSNPSNVTNIKSFNKKIYDFINTFYYIYIIKKYNFITDTKNAYISFPKQDIHSILKHPQYSYTTFDSNLYKMLKKHIIPPNNSDSSSKITNKHSKNKTTKYEYYNGEYDPSSFLYAGFGKLYKKHSSSYYEGMFRYGKHNGIGIKFKEKDIKHFIFYGGEWRKGEFHGYGMKIEIIDLTIIIKRGFFIKGLLRDGEYEKYSENNIYEITKYKGTFNDKEQYEGKSTLSINTYIKNKKNGQWEFNEEYEYEGNFIDGKENSANAIAKKNFPLKKYSYIYKGSFVNGSMNGFGIITYSGNYFIKNYEGFFQNDCTFCLYGIVTFKSGDVYEGFFDENNQKDYLGLYRHYEKDNNIGDHFFGGFQKDKKEGLGRFIAVSKKKVLVGNYTNGEKNGIFELISCNNNEITSKRKMKYHCEDNDVMESTDAFIL